MTALLVGTVLALVALAFVLVPVFRETPPSTEIGPARPDEPDETTHAVAALREVEFDRQTGKLSDDDYVALKTAYTREALAAMRAADPTGGSSDAEAEAMILAYRARGRSCETCGPRPESDAMYCSSCGRYLAGACARCGAPVTEPAARFCAACGSTLAA